MLDKKQAARIMYVVEGKTQKEIALAVGVTERTVFTWIHQYAWKKLKTAALQAPVTILENLCSQLVELQRKIAAREPGNRIPTIQEAEVTRKIIGSIAVLNKKQTLAQYMQMMESFRDFVRPLSARFSRQLAFFADKFLVAKGINGYAPWQMEYGAEKLVAIAPVYDELEGDEPCDPSNPPAYHEPCKTMHECKLGSGCEWPNCRHVNDLSDFNKQPQPDDSWPLQPISQLPKTHLNPDDFPIKS